MVVVAIDADPGDVLGAWPPRGDRAGARPIRLERPQPSDIADALIAEKRHDVPPGGYEGRGRQVPIAPRIPGGIHLMPETDDNRVAEVADAAGEGAQVAIEAPSGGPRGPCSSV